jgi:hypothetical protein
MHLRPRRGDCFVTLLAPRNDGVTQATLLGVRFGLYNGAMPQPLRRHPDSRCVAATRIDVDVARPSRGNLVLSYIVHGKINDLRLPPITAAARGRELWQQTCFEAFVGTAAGAAYYELNFAPSTQWAAYRFSSHRSGMRVATEIGAPRIEVQSSSERFTLQASLKLDELSGLPRNVGWRLGLAAITEDTSGGKSYWALAHPPGKVDFHHFDGFAHELAAA